MVRTSCYRGGELRQASGELRHAKWRAEGCVIGRSAGGGAELAKEASGVVAARFKRGPREVLFQKRSISGEFLFVGAAPGKGWNSV